MPTQLTGPGLFLKWVVAPLVLAAAGYYLVGSRVGKGGIKPTTAAESAAQSAVQAPAASISAQPTSPVDITVHKLKKKKHRRKHKVVNPDDSVTPQSDANFPQTQPPGSVDDAAPESKPTIPPNP